MPPKGIVPNLFGERKVYIGTNLCDMKPLQEITKDAITIKEETPTPEIINATGTVTVTLTFKPMFDYRELHRQALMLMGFNLTVFNVGKPRKTTYKTIRHDCAKRNGRR